MGGWLAGWVGGWLENLILMKTQSSAQTWTWTMDFDLRFVHSFILEIIVVSHFDIVNVVKD